MDIGSVLDRYEVIEELGAGGMAVVYRARDVELRREVALKVMFPHLSRRREAVARFHREARAAAALDHPGIVRIYDVGGGEAPAAGEVADPPYLVMELVPGRSLAEHATEHGPFLGEVVACVGAVICAALGKAHRAGIVHRDVKPANILVADNGRVALADFGVARIEDDDSSLVTRSGMLLGTPAFMSPEQAMGDALDERSDLYSLGATLYQLATGSLPYAGSAARVMTGIAEGSLVAPLQRNPRMGAELARIIERMMARDPAQRYQNAEQAAAALRAVAVAGLGETAIESELARFFAGPAEYTREVVPQVVAATLRRAREAARERRLPRAIGLADRALALDPDCQEAMELVRRLGVGRRRRLWIAGACAALVVGGGAAATVGWRAPGAAVPPAALVSMAMDGSVPVLARAGSLDAGLLAVAPGPVPGEQPAGIAVETRRLVAPEAGPVDGADPALGAGRRSSRKTPRAPAPGQRLAARATAPESTPATNPTPDGDGAGSTIAGGAADGAADDGAGAEAPGAGPAAPAPPARLSVDITPWCDLRIDGTSHGRARRDRIIDLAPGRHELECSQGPGRASWREAVHLAPGERRHLTGSVLQPVRIRIAVRGGDRVLIDTRPHPNGSTLDLSPGRHRITVLAGAQEVAGAWVAIPAVPDCTLRDHPALDCYR